MHFRTRGSLNARRAAGLTALVLLGAACADHTSPVAPAAPEVSSSVNHSAAPVTVVSSGVAASCAGVLAADPTAVDGMYAIAPAPGVAFQVHCAGMASATPAEYLTLVQTGPAFNFSSSNSHTPLRTTHYARLRLDPVTLRVDIGDATFASTVGGVRVGYASASACAGNFRRTANIDLQGTPFGVNSSFRISGWFSHGSINGTQYSFTGGGSGSFPVTGQVVDLAGGGSCGGISASWDFHDATLPALSPGYDLQLAFLGPSLDVTAPTISISGNETYEVHQQVAVTCTFADEPGGSGLDTTSCSAQQGPAYSFGVGAHPITASASDNAGNTSTATTSFTVEVTPASLCSLVQQFVSQAGIANSLCQQLGNGAYGAFANHVRAQSDRHVSAAHAAILLALVVSL